jgi:hypothetical protein
VKLYELPRNSKFQIVDGGTDYVKRTYTLKHIDGMYSYCYDSEGKVAHIAAFADVEKVDE